MGGAVGYIGYEYIHRIEPTVPEAARDELGIPLVYFMLSDTLLMFDRAKQTLRLCVNAHVPPSTGSSQAVLATYAAAVAELHSLYALLKQPRELASSALADPPQIEIPPSNFTPAEFEQMVEDVKEYIRAGDIIQVVLAQRFVREFTRTPLDLYRALRTVNPSPYMFLLDTGDFALVGASPEVHVRLTDGRVEIRPIAGTRRRGASAGEDAGAREGAARRREGARRTPHARRPGPKRHRARLQLRQRHRAGIHDRRALFPRHAHRLAGRRPHRARTRTPST